MARRGRASSAGFNVSQEVRKIVEADNEITGRGVYEQLEKKYPGKPINSGTVGVAYSKARASLGLTRSVKKRRPAGRVGRRPGRPAGSTMKSTTAATTSSSSSVGFDILSAAKSLLAACNGDASVAAAAVKQVQSLQIS